jgi:hypothetical protein
MLALMSPVCLRLILCPSSLMHLICVEHINIGVSLVVPKNYFNCTSFATISSFDIT